MDIVSAAITATCECGGTFTCSEKDNAAICTNCGAKAGKHIMGASVRMLYASRGEQEKAKAAPKYKAKKASNTPKSTAKPKKKASTKAGNK